MATTTKEAPPHTYGCGRIAVPPSEIDSGRRGALGLLDASRVPVRLEGVRPGARVYLTVALPPGQPVIDPEVPRWPLLGVGRLFTMPTLVAGRPATAVGASPDDERTTGWLHLPVQADLTEGLVWLGAHPAWPCPYKAGRRQAWFARGESS